MGVCVGALPPAATFANIPTQEHGNKSQVYSYLGYAPLDNRLMTGTSGVGSDSILRLIINANWIVQLVMLGLLIASIVSWTYIFRHIRLLKKTIRADKSFDDRFWSGMDITQLYREHYENPDENSGLARIFISGFREFSKLSQQTQAPDVVMEGVQRMMRVALSREQERLDKHIPYLATLGSTAPYVGLFGTVIGVMNAFRGLATVQQTTLAAVAPGIAEALVATAIGLIAAIPAVVAYNRFNSKIEHRLASYETFSEEFSGILHRKLHSQTQTTTSRPSKEV